MTREELEQQRTVRSIRRAARLLPAGREARAAAEAQRTAAAQAKARELRAAGVHNGGWGPRR